MYDTFRMVRRELSKAARWTNMRFYTVIPVLRMPGKVSFSDI